MPHTTHLSPDEVDAYARAGEEALNRCLGRVRAEDQAAFWHAIRRCYVQSPASLPLDDLAALPEAAAIPAAHVIQASAELQ
ncbi:hypothetical protein [Methylobacterium sp. ID0610]|uniref:hypothetical protein n=1 Tax=Methylobacterium carpenticola TaxID=3344827 RepID=UPI0036BD79CA